MKIAVTGTPGTGKTTVARRLAEELGVKYVDLTEEVRSGASAGYDEGRDTHVADIDALEDGVPEDAVLDGHVAHRIENDYTVVLRCAPDELRQRLSERGWEDAKVTENVESEILDVVLAEALESGAPVFEYDTTEKTPDETVERLLDAIEEEETRNGTVNRADEIREVKWNGSDKS